jgi:hypothetical protein
MKKVGLILASILITVCGFGQVNSNELALSIAPLKLNKPINCHGLYRRALNNNYLLRAQIGFNANTNKEVRNDTTTYQGGHVAYDVSLGVQKNLHISDLDVVNLYVAIDGYWNSKFNREAHETYYGYFWDFGARPLVGIAYEPFNNIRLSLESQSNFNINLQEYSAPGENKDTRVKFNSFDRLAFNIGYLF